MPWAPLDAMAPLHNIEKLLFFIACLAPQPPRGFLGSLGEALGLWVHRRCPGGGDLRLWVHRRCLALDSLQWGSNGAPMGGEGKIIYAILICLIVFLENVLK